MAEEDTASREYSVQMRSVTEAKYKVKNPTKEVLIKDAERIMELARFSQ